MTTLVDDLLLLARLDSGRPLSTDEVDLTLLVIDAVTDAHVAGPRHRWQLDLPDGAGDRSPGDAARLHQVLANLLANARTHTPAGTTVDTVAAPSDDDRAVIRVTDDGPGIPGRPAAGGLRPVRPGRLLPLPRAPAAPAWAWPSSSAVVDAHGGRVEVASHPGHTAFTVWLPVHQPGK